MRHNSVASVAIVHSRWSNFLEYASIKTILLIFSGVHSLVKFFKKFLASAERVRCPFAGTAVLRRRLRCSVTCVVLLYILSSEPRLSAGLKIDYFQVNTAPALPFVETGCESQTAGASSGHQFFGPFGHAPGDGPEGRA